MNIKVGDVVVLKNPGSVDPKILDLRGISAQSYKKLQRKPREIVMWDDRGWYGIKSDRGLLYWITEDLIERKE